MPRVVWRSMLVCLVCAPAQLLRAQEPAATDAALEAMLLPPVDGQLALWVNQPANFAVVGVAPEHGADILYQQTALEGVPASGYIYVPRGDAGYDRVYLVASKDPLDLSGTVDDAMSSATVLDAYAANTIPVDSLFQCVDGRLLLVRTEFLDHEAPRRQVIPNGECRRNAPDEVRRFQRPYLFAAGRGFFFPTRPAPTHKPLPPKYRPRLGEADQHALRWLASKDQWHAITHNGEPGTDLPRALGYVQYHGEWVLGRSNPALMAVRSEIRAIMNGTVGGVPSKTALVMQPAGGIATAQLLVSHEGTSPGSSPRIEYVVHTHAPTYSSSGGGYSGSGGYSGNSSGSGSAWSAHSSAPVSSSTGWHESTPHISVSAPSTPSSAPLSRGPH